MKKKTWEVLYWGAVNSNTIVAFTTRWTSILCNAWPCWMRGKSWKPDFYIIVSLQLSIFPRKIVKWMLFKICNNRTGNSLHQIHRILENADWTVGDFEWISVVNEHPSTRKTAERTKIFKGEVIVSLALSSIQGEGGGGR